MKIAAIMQPTYLPWVGYFNLMAMADVFVFFDDQRFTPRSWHHRNKIIVDGKEQWLSIPVKGGRDQRLCDCVVDDSQPWREKHVAAIRRTYGGMAAGSEVARIVDTCLTETHCSNLSNLNKSITLAIAERMGIKPLWFSASTMVFPGSHLGTKSGRAIDLCKGLGCDTLYNASGAREFVEAEGLFAADGIDVVYQEIPAHWPQISIVDVIARHGFDYAAQLAFNREPSEQMV